MAKKRQKARGKGEPTKAGRPDQAPNIPVWLPATLFVGLTLLLFREFVFSDQMLFGGDTIGLGYVARAFYADVLTGLGTVPRWAPMILGGTPFIEALASGDSLYPPSVLLLMVMDPYRALGWKLVIHVAVAGFFMFGWVRAIGASRPAALLGATAYMVAPYFVSLVYPGHDGKIFVTALAPLLFWAVERHFSRPKLETVTAIALVVGLVLYTTHFQMAYFLFGAVGMYATYRTIELWQSAEPAAEEEATSHRKVRPAASHFGLFLAAAVMGAGIAAVQFVPAVDYVTQYSRRVRTTGEAATESGVAWSSSWSLHPEDVAALVIPEFSGNNSGGADWSQGTYWGRNFTKDNHESAGLVILLLAAVSFVGGARRGLRFFFAGLGILALLFGLGAHTPVWRIFYEVVPGIRLFRAPGQVMFLFAFGASTLGALGLDRILDLARTEDREGWSRVMKVLGAAGGGLALLALLASSGILTSVWTSTVYSSVSAQRLQLLESLQPFIARGAGIAFLLGLSTAGVVWASRAGYLAPAGVVAALVLLVAVDELRVSNGFVQVIDFEQWAAPDGYTQAVLQRETGSDEPYRMLSFRQAGQDVRPALHGIELAAGHHPNDLSRYRELIGMVGSGLPQNLFDADIRRLLNVRYILWTDYAFDGQAFPGPPESIIARSQLPDGSAYETMHLEADLPRARLVGASVVKSDADAVPYILSEAFDPDAEVVLAEPSPIALDGAPADGTVRWTERSPNRLALDVTTARPALLVIADNWFPAWQATVDGEAAPVMRAYHTLRAVPVPAGAHTVEMVYESRVVGRSLLLSILLTIGLVGATAVQMARATLGEGVLKKAWLLRVGQLALTVLVTWFIVDRVGLGLGELRGLEPSAWLPAPAPFLAASLLLLAAYFLSAALWGRIVHDLGGPKIPVGESIQLFMIANLGRYVPGKVWQIAGLAALAKSRGVPATTGTGAAVLGQGIALVAASAIGMGALMTGPEPYRTWEASVGWRSVRSSCSSRFRAFSKRCPPSGSGSLGRRHPRSSDRSTRSGGWASTP